MKKWIVTVLMMIGMISMVGCSDAHETVENMYIEPAQLTEEEEKIASKIENAKDQANYYYDHVFQTMAEVRKPADALEMLVAKEDWPFPSYGDMLFDN